MKKNRTSLFRDYFIPGRKYLRIMKLTFIFILLGLMSFASVSYSQATRLSFESKNVTIESVFKKIESLSEFKFAYNSTKLDVEKIISLKVDNQTINAILDKILGAADLQYKIVDRYIIITDEYSSNSSFLENSTQQQKSVSGKVTDSSGASLPGVSVVVKGTTNGSITDANGNYSISNIPENATLQFSFVGMKGQEVVVEGKSTINVTLAEDAIGLEEVVAVGYGSKKEHAITGAISTIKATEIEGRPITQASQILYGLTPGIYANANTGEAGNGQTTFSIRGVGTLNNASALVLVDGIEAPIDNINPSDIESVTILKDAAAAAIYGSRAANGVVLVTTKRGKFDSKTKVSYNGYFGLSSPTVLPDMVTDNETYLKLYKEAAANSKVSTAGITDADIDRYKNLPSTNWFDVIFNKQAPIQEHRVSYSSGNDNLSVYASLGYLNQMGIIKKTGFERYNTRVNLDAKITNKLKVGASLSYSFSVADLAVKEGPEYNSTNTDVNSLTGKGSLAFEAALTQHPIAPVYDSHGRYATLEQKLGVQRNRNNGQAILDNEFLVQKDSKFLGDIYAEYELIHNLKIKGSAALNNQQTGYVDTRKQYSNYDPVTEKLVSTTVPGSYLTDVQEFPQNVTLVLQASYEKIIGNHNFSSLLGYNQESATLKTNANIQTNFSTTSLVTLGNGATTLVAKTTQGEWAMRSVFGRFSYEYAGKYLFEATVRRDGSSRFGANNRYGIFPSFSTGWIVSNEKFWNKNIINLLKFRGSWGMLGNQNTELYPFASQVGMNNNYSLNNTNTGGGAIIVMGNPDLKWESTTTTDLGVNLKLFKSKLSFDADYFIRDTKDILTPINNPLTLGITFPTIINAASVQNKGWEFSSGYNFVIGKVNASIGGNLTYMENKVTAINPTLSSNDDKVQLNGPSNVWLINGEPINTIYGYKMQGIFQSVEEIASAADHSLFGTPQPGDFRLQDTDKDGKITIKDRVVLGDRQPKLLYGFNFKFNYKGFEISALFQGVGTHYIYQSRQVGPFAFAGIRKFWLDRWTPENPSNTMPRVWIDRSGYNGATIETLPSSFWVQDLAYLRLKTLQVGYTIPKMVFDDLHIESLRVYLNADNLLTFTKYKDFDPERLTTQQYVTNSLPQLKIITAGINITF